MNLIKKISLLTVLLMAIMTSGFLLADDCICDDDCVRPCEKCKCD